MNIRRCYEPFSRFLRNCHTSSVSEPTTQFIKIKYGNELDRKIAYEKLPGSRKEGLLFIPGWLQGRNGNKATRLVEFSREHDFPYIRYDPTSVGNSMDLPLEKARFHHWIQDAEEVLTQVTDGKQIVIGSSMGGWIATILAIKYPEKLSKLILVAPGLNFFERAWKMVDSYCPPEIMARIKTGETVVHTYGHLGTFPFSLALGDSFNAHNIDFEKKININCPVRILHGMKDESLPHMGSLKLLEALSTEDVKLIFFKDGDHQLSSEKNMQALFHQILDE